MLSVVITFHASLLRTLLNIQLKVYYVFGSSGSLWEVSKLSIISTRITDHHISMLAALMRTRRMATANGTCVSFCNQPKGHYLATSRESCRYVVAGASIWLRQESLRHILASPGYAPGTIAIHFTWMEREFNACQTHRSMYPSIFNRFPVIQAVSL